MKPDLVRAGWISALLILATVAVFYRIGDHAFAIDVGEYIADNPHVRGGLTARSVAWSVTGVHANNWHPVTWLSHMLDVELYGLNPRGHHLTNLLLHAANAVVLLLVLWRMTSRFWPSALVAALFALHPLHVESVAWALERKDVLSTLFLLLTLACYTRYAAGPTVVRSLPVLLLFALGLMAKPMLVTLPLLLLVLDFWPLRRMTSTGLPRLILEKTPLLLLALAVSAITVVAQGDAVASFEQFPLRVRIGNAVVSYVAYGVQMLWPAGLAFYYPHPKTVPLPQLLAATSTLLALSAFAFGRFRSLPWLAAGWSWYLLTLLPVIGIVQVGAQARADRYTYVPLIGLFVTFAWGAAAVAERRPAARTVVAGICGSVVVALAVASWYQVGHWKDTISLLTRSSEVTEDNYFAHYNLGNHLKRAGNVKEAIDHYLEALRIEPRSVAARYNLGNALVEQGRLDEAKLQYTEVLRQDPDYIDGYYALGNTEMSSGNIPGAIEQYRAGLAIERDPELLNNLGIALIRADAIDEAIESLQEAVRLGPDARRHNNLGVALLRRERLAEAIVEFERALRLDPGHDGARTNLVAARAARPGGTR